MKHKKRNQESDWLKKMETWSRYPWKPQSQQKDTKDQQIFENFQAVSESEHDTLNFHSISQLAETDENEGDC